MDQEDRERIRQLEQQLAALTRRVEILEHHAGITPAGSFRPPADRAAGGVSDHVRSLVAAGRTIQAIKAHRQETGLGLREAKQVVEDVAAGRR